MCYTEKQWKEKNHLLDNDFKIIKIWECELKTLRESSIEIDEYFINHLRYFNSLKFSPPLQPREAFYGGRVNASKLYHEVGVHEKIYYYDFTSLYPYVCKYGTVSYWTPKTYNKPRLK